MPVTFTFHKISEKKPEHHQQIVWMHPVQNFDSYGFEPRYCSVAYIWSEIDDEGDDTGSTIRYNPEDNETPDGCRLMILFDRFEAREDWLWMDLEDYQDVLLTGLED